MSLYRVEVQPMFISWVGTDWGNTKLMLGPRGEAKLVRPTLRD